MEFLTNFFLVIGGSSVAIGVLSFLAGLNIRSSRTYLYFGVFSIGAGLYYLIFLGHATTGEFFGISYRLLISAAAVYYLSFPWFIAEFSGSRKRGIPLLLSLTILAGYVVFLFSDLQIHFPVWQAIVHAGSLGTGIYGIYRGWQLTRRSLGKGIIFTISVIVFFLGLVEEIIAVQFGPALIPRIESTFMPLDFYPVFFVLIMSAVLVQDLVSSYRLQIQVTDKELKWSTLMDNVQLIVTELDLEGRIKYINSYYESLTGYTYREVCGKNWFDIMIPNGEKEKMSRIFREELTGKQWPEYQNSIITSDGRTISINWSNLPIKDNSGKFSGVLSIGFDLTQQEKRLSEIQELKKKLEKENLLLQEEISGRSGGFNIIGESSSIKYAINKALQVAPLDSTVLLEGETGVGKELFADLIQSRSSRRRLSYLKVNCAAIPRELIESEFFGHKKGSFTGAVSDTKGVFTMADRGTIFLDEVSAMPLDLQSKLLRVLQNGEFNPVGSERTVKVNVRIIAATNDNLKEKSENNDFRKDLYYRLNVYPVTIPPLRQRTEDIPLLISHFSQIIGKRLNKKVGKVSRSDLENLMQYQWPGNVRELENWVERAIITSRDDQLRFTTEQIQEARASNGATIGVSTDSSMEEIQRDILLRVLEECDWKINGEDGAAVRLKLPPSTLRSRMKKLGIERPV
jgi:PAS domain S-box-containing protein